MGWFENFQTEQRKRDAEEKIKQMQKEAADDLKEELEKGRAVL